MIQGTQKLITLLSVVYVVFVIDGSPVQGMKAKFNLKRFGPQRFTARIILQSRRLRIVKCCGRESCSLPGRLRNGTGQFYTKPTKNKWNFKRRPTKTTNLASTLTANTDASNPGNAAVTTAAPGVEETPEVAAESVPPDATEAASEETSTEPPAVGYTGATAGENGDYGEADAPTSAIATNSVPPPTNNGLTGSDPATTIGSTTAGPVSATSSTSPTKSSDSISYSTTPILNGQTSTLTSLDSSSTTSAGTKTGSTINSVVGASSTSSSGGPAADSTSASITSTRSSTTAVTSTGVSTTNPPTSTTNTASTTTPASTTTAIKTTKTIKDSSTEQSTTTASVTTSTSTSTTTSSKPCKDEGCGTSCVKDPALFPSGVLTVPSSRGSFAAICSKKYFMSIERTNQSIARQSCCAMGMTLSILETRAEQDCITKYNDDVSKKLAIYWVGATDMYCSKNFTWCSGMNLTLSTYDWIIAQPNYLGGNQTCMVHVTDFGRTVPFLGFVKGDNGLNDWECYDMNEYLCEEP